MVIIFFFGQFDNISNSKNVFNLERFYIFVIILLFV